MRTALQSTFVVCCALLKGTVPTGHVLLQRWAFCAALHHKGKKGVKLHDRHSAWSPTKHLLLMGQNSAMH